MSLTYPDLQNKVLLRAEFSDEYFITKIFLVEFNTKKINAGRVCVRPISYCHGQFTYSLVVV